MIEEIREPLEQIRSGVPGALAITLMGMDGLPVDSLEASADEQADVDVAALLIEYSSLLTQVRKSAQMFAAGGLEEISIASERVTTIIRPLSTDYFLALALAPGANFGKGRYLLRLFAPRLARALA